MRLHLLPVVFVTAAVVLAGCAEPAPLPLPAGLPLDRMTPAQRALVRMTLTVDADGVERPLVFHPDALAVSGELALDNVGEGGVRAVLMRAYGRLEEEASEALLGEVPGTVTVQKGGAAFVEFSGQTFDICGAVVDGGACTLRFDTNRNGAPNVEDLVNGIDAAPQAAFLFAADTLQFPSGVRIGEVARQVIVVDNLSDHTVELVAIRAAGGQGVAVSTYSADDAAAPPPRRVLELADLDDDGDGRSDFVVLPGEEAYAAVSFSPANRFFTTASVQIIGRDTVTGVTQAVRTKVIGNPEGALRPRDPTYEEPVDLPSLTTAGGTVQAQAFPASELFSGVEIAGVDNPDTAEREEAQLVSTGARLVGAGFDVPADVAFTVDVPAKSRFTAVLSGLVDGSDVDVTVVDVGDAAAPALLGASTLSGASAEAVEVASGETGRRVAVVLGRVEADAPPSVVGGLSANEPVPFRLTCQVTRGPEFIEDEPVAPTHGALGGGITVRMRGTGFFLPDDRAVGPHVKVSFDGVPAVGVPQVVLGEDGVQTITVVLPPGAAAVADRPVSVTVENPTSSAGTDGDGQAVTLANGFRYDLPTPRLNVIAPDVGSTAGGDVAVTLTGAFFFDTYGPPQVAFDDEIVDAEFIDNGTLQVFPPARAAGEVRVTVRNVIFDGDVGEPSNVRAFRFVEPSRAPPRIDSLAPASGTADGGTVVTLTGTSFDDGGGVDGDGVRVFFGANAATVRVATPTQLEVIAPTTSSSGEVDVVVQNGDGGLARSPTRFTYTLPVPRIDRVFPARATVAGGTPVIVDGAGFRVDVDVVFAAGGGTLPATAVTIVSPERMLVTTPPFDATENARLIVTNANGVAAEAAFAFFEPQGPPPRIVALDPAVVGIDGQDTVTVVGTGFSTGGVDVIVGATTLTDVAVGTAAAGLQQVRFAAPAGPEGPTLVTIVNDDGQSDGALLTYVDVGEPRLLDLRPAVVHAGIRGDTVVVHGENLDLLGTADRVVARALAAPTAAELTNGRATALSVAVEILAGSLARLRLVDPVPAQARFLAVTLAGRAFVVQSPAVPARLPTVKRVQIDGERSGDTIVDGAVLLLGDNLAGDRVGAVTLDGGVPCLVVGGDEGMVLCSVVQAAASALVAPLDVDLRYDATNADGDVIASDAVSITVDSVVGLPPPAEPEIVAVQGDVLHAGVRGDSVAVIGRNLDRLGPSGTLAARALVGVAPGSFVEVALEVVEATPATVVVRFPSVLPEGEVTIELSGSAFTVAARPVRSRRPDVRSVVVDGARNSIVLNGDALAGARLTGVIFGSAPAGSCFGDEHEVVCELVELPAAAFIGPQLAATLLYTSEGAGGAPVEDVLEETIEAVSFPRLVGWASTVVHAGIRGDVLKLMGQGLSSIDVAGSLSARAFVVAGATAPVEVPAVVQTVSESEATVRLTAAPLPGDLFVELVGRRIRTAASPPLPARRPDIGRAEVDGRSGELQLGGDQLAGARLTEVRIGDERCLRSSGSEQQLRCAFVDTIPAAIGAPPVAVTMHYGEGDAVDVVFDSIDVVIVPRVVGLTPGTVHAGLRGDALLAFGEQLDRLGDRSVVRAEAFVTVPGPERVPVAVAVDAIAGSVAHLRLVGPAPVGSLVVELFGPRFRTAASPPVPTRAPDVTRLEIDGATGQVLLIGDQLAGARLQDIAIGASTCAVVVGEERRVLCALVGIFDVSAFTPPLTVALRYDGEEANPDVVNDTVTDLLVETAPPPPEPPPPPTLLAVEPPVVHALVPGDVLVAFGTRLTALGAPVVATAVVTAPDDGGGTTTTRVGLEVLQLSDPVARLRVRADAPLPAGEVVVELVGTGTPLLSPPVVARAPDVLHLFLGASAADPAAAGVGSGTQFTLFGENLAGDRLQSVAVQSEDASSYDVDCPVLAATDGVIVCDFAGAAQVDLALPLDGLFVALTYEGGRVVRDRIDSTSLETGGAIVPQLCGNGSIDEGETCDGDSILCTNCVEAGEPLNNNGEESPQSAITGFFTSGQPQQRWLAPVGDSDNLVFSSDVPVHGLLSVRVLGMETCPESLRVFVSRVLAPRSPTPGACGAIRVDLAQGGLLSVGIQGGSTVPTVQYEMSFTSDINVDTFNDIVATNGACSLPEALLTAASEAHDQDCGGGRGMRTIRLPEGTISLGSRLTVAPGVRIIGRGLGGPEQPLSAIAMVEGAAGHFAVDAGVQRADPVVLEQLVLEGAAQRSIIGDGDVNLTAVRVQNNAGGGIAVAGTVVVDLGTFLNNSSDAGGAIDVGAGAQISDSTFENNDAVEVSVGAGGAIRAQSGFLTVVRSEFSGNVARLSGGAIAAGGNLQISESAFRNNIAGSAAEVGHGGAIDAFGAGTELDVSLSLLADNRAFGDGGAIRSLRTGQFSDLVVVNNEASAVGGGIAVQQPVDVLASIFLRNKAASGGALAVTGTEGETTVKNTHLQDNRAFDLGGAIFAARDIALTSTAVVDNRAEQSDPQAVGNAITGRGGGVAVIGAQLKAAYVTVAHNTARLRGGGLFLAPTNGAVVKDSIVSANVGLGSNTGHDCDADNSPAPVDVRGKNVFGPVGSCTLTTTNGSFFAADPALRVLRNSTGITTSTAPPDDAARAIDIAVPRPSSIIVSATQFKAGNCQDLDNAVVADDAAGDGRPAQRCTIGAVELAETQSFNQIVVTSLTDDGQGCTLRDALLAASTASLVDGCSAQGAVGVDEIVFDETVFGQPQAANIQLAAANGALPVSDGETIIDGIAGRPSLPNITITGVGFSSVFEINAPARLRGLKIVGANNPQGAGPAIRVGQTSVVLDESTVAASVGDGQSGAFELTQGSFAGVTLVRSAVDGGFGGGTPTVLVRGQARFFAHRWTAWSDERPLLRVEATATATLTHSTAAIAITDVASPPAAIENEGLLSLRGSLLQASSPCADASENGVVRSLGGNLVTDFCNGAAAEDDVVGTIGFLNGELQSSPLAMNGGRTPTLAVDGALQLGDILVATVATCFVDDRDARGFPEEGLAAGDPCTPGAFEFNATPVCGNGFVERQVVEKTATVTAPTLSSSGSGLLPFSGTAIASTAADIDGNGPDWLVLTASGVVVARANGTTNFSNATSNITLGGLGGINVPGQAIAAGNFVGGPGVDVLVAGSLAVAAAADVPPQNVTFTQLGLDVVAVTDIAMVDLDQSGYDDLLVADENGLMIYAGGSSGLATTGVSVPGPAGFDAHRLRVADVNNDGAVDVLVSANNANDNIHILLAGDGTFSSVGAGVVGLRAGQSRGFDVVSIGNKRYLGAVDSANGTAAFVELVNGTPTGQPITFAASVTSSGHDLLAVPGGLVVARVGATEWTATAIGGSIFPEVGNSVTVPVALAPQLVHLGPSGVAARVGFVRGTNGIGTFDFLGGVTEAAEACDPSNEFSTVLCTQQCTLVASP